MVNLVSKKCVPCEGGTPPLEAEKIQEYLKEVEGWEAREGKMITRRFTFKSFREAIDFVNRVAGLAEREGHHPDIIIRYNKVTLELSTHAIGGLSENDFILASKIDLTHKWEEKVEKVVVKKFFTVKILLVIVFLLALLLWWKKFLN
ncbi:MAG: 4a-hydroxytetrahydrobiopterin dehydratase [Candidatus Wildermuthbacteria bacterium]|nr:4a-hydroxytetrahydrobiopterin dehydratase [Candidatus Wildermuthbacteria bacterium]